MINRDIDKANMFEALRAFPMQFRKSLRFSDGIRVDGPIDKVVVAGMGGSSFPGSVVRTYLESLHSPIAFELSRDYVLRVPVTDDTLVFVSSFSGNTEETIFALYDAMRKGTKIVVVAAEGHLVDLALEYEFPLVRIEKDSPTFQPRWSSGYFVGCFLNVLQNSGLIEDCRDDLRKLEAFLNGLNVESRARELAAALANRIPVIYSSYIYGESLARIIKIKLNENAKTQAFYNVFPDMNHNEMIGFTHPRASYFFVIIRDPDDHPRIKRRMDIFENVFSEQLGVPVFSIVMEGDNVLEKIFGVMYLFDWVSYFLALEYQVDPTPVNLVEEFKKLLGNYRVGGREFTQGVV